ncbi:MAG: ARMT1-like domain-containing protein [bacterium]
MTPASGSIDPIRTNEGNWFAWNTMQKRLPGNIRYTARTNPDFTDPERARLLELAEAIEVGSRIPEPGATWYDYEWWMRQFEPHRDEHWHDAPWFFAETYAFRLILDASRFFEHGRDPFWYTKKADLDNAHAFAPVRLFSSAETPDDDPGARLLRAMEFATWGNRADLSFSAGTSPERGHGTADLLVVHDETEALKLLRTARRVHIVTDNAGAELAGDLLLIRELLLSGADVVCHVKYHPTYVSDTTVRDVHYFLERAGSAGSDAVRAIARDIQTGFDDERIHLQPDPYWCSTLFFPDLPLRMRRVLETADLLIVKGDLNYRRVFQDTIWPIGTDVRAAVGTSGLPPMILLRGMKSDVIWGLDQETVSALDAEDQSWRINGKRAVIQVIDLG